eukprot:149824-Chlamydomonas_euryale.AAC.1
MAHACRAALLASAHDHLGHRTAAGAGRCRRHGRRRRRRGRCRTNHRRMTPPSATRPCRSAGSAGTVPAER